MKWLLRTTELGLCRSGIGGAHLQQNRLALVKHILPDPASNSANRNVSRGGPEDFVFNKGPK